MPATQDQEGQSQNPLFQRTLRSGRQIGIPATPSMAQRSSATGGQDQKLRRSAVHVATRDIQTSKKKSDPVVKHNRVTRQSAAQQKLERHKKTIAESLTCAICWTLIYRPLILTSCAHTFCSSCVSRLFDTAAQAVVDFEVKCPTCRSPVFLASKDAHTSDLLDAFLEMFPDLKPDAATCAAKDLNDKLYTMQGSVYWAPHMTDGMRFHL
uniref:RING-type domain-containing protein n=1 Tax=Steinernema glaseri TaxID=37863 RepID=A0A1I7Y337_9BILA